MSLMWAQEGRPKKAYLKSWGKEICLQLSRVKEKTGEDGVRGGQDNRVNMAEGKGIIQEVTPEWFQRVFLWRVLKCIKWNQMGMRVMYKAYSWMLSNDWNTQFVMFE